MKNIHDSLKTSYTFVYIHMYIHAYSCIHTRMPHRRGHVTCPHFHNGNKNFIAVMEFHGIQLL